MLVPRWRKPSVEGNADIRQPDLPPMIGACGHTQSCHKASKNCPIANIIDYSLSIISHCHLIILDYILLSMYYLLLETFVSFNFQVTGMKAELRAVVAKRKEMRELRAELGYKREEELLQRVALINHMNAFCGQINCGRKQQDIQEQVREIELIMSSCSLR